MNRMIVTIAVFLCLFNSTMVMAENGWAVFEQYAPLRLLYSDMTDTLNILPKPLNVIINDFNFKGHEEIAQFINSDFSNILQNINDITVFDNNHFLTIINSMRISQKDINDPEIRKEFVKYSNCQAICNGIMQTDNDKVYIEVKITDLLTNEIILSMTNSIPKTNEIKMLLGEKVPGLLTVNTNPENGMVYINSEFRGNTVNNTLTMTLDEGNYDLNITKVGYPKFNKSIFIEPNKSKTINVQFIIDETYPMKALLSTAILPGFLGEKYRGNYTTNRSVAQYIYYTSAWVLYISGWNYYKTNKSSSLGIAIGSYTINLITAYIAGSDYSKLKSSVKEVY